MHKLNFYHYLIALSLSLFSTHHYAQNTIDTFSLEQLMAFMTKHKEIHATFVEKKYMSGIKAPIESSGVLNFIAPATMVRNTLQPKPEMFKLTESTITMELKGKIRSLQINDYPELAIHFEGIRALLSGNIDKMTRLYEAHLTGTSANWELILRPLKEGTTLKKLRLNGSQDNVKSVEVHLEDGDYSIMQISREDTIH